MTKKKPRNEEDVLPGMGGSRHKYLQSLVSKIAKDKGIEADIEYPTHTGGRVDVAIFSKEKIACEISITTKVNHEVGNIEKGLKAGFDKVLVISPKANHLEKIREAAEENNNIQIGKVAFLLPDQVIEYLEQHLKEPPIETTVKGFKVKVIKKMLSPDEQQRRKDAISSVIAKSLESVG